MNQTVEIRLRTCRDARSEHVYETAAPKKATHFISGDGEETFHNLDDLAYYERLTGHIAELEFLAEALPD
jgi:hypothetical protein